MAENANDMWTTDILTDPRIYLWNLRPKMVSTDSWSRCPCTNTIDTNRSTQMPAIRTLWSLHRRRAHAQAYKRTQHWLDWWRPHPKFDGGEGGGGGKMHWSHISRRARICDMVAYLPSLQQKCSIDRSQPHDCVASLKVSQFSATIV